MADFSNKKLHLANVMYILVKMSSKNMKIEDLGPYYASQIHTLKKRYGDFGLWTKELAETLHTADHLDSSIDKVLHVAHKLQRLQTILSADLTHNTAFRAACTHYNPPDCANWSKIDAPRDLQTRLATMLIDQCKKPGAHVLLDIGEYAHTVGVELARQLHAMGRPVTVYFADPDFRALVFGHCTRDAVNPLGADYLHMVNPIHHVIQVQPSHRKLNAPPPPADIVSAYMQTRDPFYERMNCGDINYTMTTIPTPKSAEIESIDYAEYTRLYFELCDQPWSQIKAAQGLLIKHFDKASNIRIQNNDGTDLSMSMIDHDGSHFTFCNSTIGKNIPGSEIFSAPRIDSTNGRIIAMGRFGDEGEIENMRLKFKDGVLISYECDHGLESLTQRLATDDGARRVGEIGFGTNPHLKRHLANDLLVEKIRGFHVALGAAYTYTEYDGRQVKVNNGVKSDLHWDITTMLYGKDGRIDLDGQPIMLRGEWLVAGCEILNQGWQAMPAHERPPYWKNYDFKP